MTATRESVSTDAPRVIPVRDGGYLAVAPASSSVRIAGYGRTEAEAQQHYSDRRAAWDEILSRP